MELTSKQRAQLRSLATNLDTIVHVGKDGIGDNLVKVIGSKFVLYRMQHDKSKRKIELVKAKRSV